MSQSEPPINHDYSWEQFALDIIKMNYTYELPVQSVPTTNEEQLVKRLQDFLAIINKEIAEGFELQDALLTGLDGKQAAINLADWYADIVVYVFSEAARHGIPLRQVLGIVMESNMTKLGKDGKPIKDKNGKFLKGPNFAPPEPKIAALFEKLWVEGREQGSQNKTFVENNTNKIGN